MSVRPQDITEEEEPKGGTKSGEHAGGAGGDGASRCCVIL